MKAKILVMRPDEPAETVGFKFDVGKPNPNELENVFAAIFGSAILERVRVLADLDGGTDYTYLHMIVDVNGALKGLPRNEVATAIYRRNILHHELGYDPGAIYGPAVLFPPTVFIDVREAVENAPRPWELDLRRARPVGDRERRRALSGAWLTRLKRAKFHAATLSE